MKEIIYQLELSLLKRPISYAELALLLADNFVEYGSSGRIYSKANVLLSLPHETQKTFTIENFNITQLSQDVILANYKITINSIPSLRCSIWQYNINSWQMLFHQGTRCE